MEPRSSYYWYHDDPSGAHLAKSQPFKSKASLYGSDIVSIDLMFDQLIDQSGHGINSYLTEIWPDPIQNGDDFNDCAPHLRSDRDQIFVDCPEQRI